jgi:hypothetical protein
MAQERLVDETRGSCWSILSFIASCTTFQGCPYRSPMGRGQFADNITESSVHGVIPARPSKTPMSKLNSKVQPPPAFSGLLTDSAKWFRISAGHSCKGSYQRVNLGLVGMI